MSRHPLETLKNSSYVFRHATLYWERQVLNKHYYFFFFEDGGITTCPWNDHVHLSARGGYLKHWCNEMSM